MKRSVLEQALYDVRMERKRRLADQAAKDFYVFFKEFAWPVLEPGTVYVDNWHIEALCRHLEAVTYGDITRLLVNIPYRQLKSRIISQAWPVWEWIQMPSIQFLTASYARDLAIRDAVDSRRIIESDEFQQCFGDRFQMTSDQNVKSRYENDKRGMRTITATDAAATGFGGNRIIVDDPISALDADNEVARKRAIEWWRGTVATRFNNPKEDAAVIVQQRLNELDLSGYLLSNHPGEWEHLVFPMWYEPTRPVYVGGKLQEVPTQNIKTKIGYTDPRHIEPVEEVEVNGKKEYRGALLNPKRLDGDTVRQMEKDLGTYHTAAQLQQRPVARGGIIFKRADWKYYKELPAKLDEIVLSVDCAFKDKKTSDYVAVQVWGRKGAEYYLIKRLREHMGFGATVTSVKTHKALFPKAVATLIEDKANGSAVIETLKGEVNGVLAIEPEGGKVARAYAVQPTHEAGNIYLPDPSIDADIETFLSEVSSFPNAPHDDETDAFTQAINWFKNRVMGTGILDYYRQQLEEQRQREQGNR
jgi:predicted phage terminase large subunit-like protein